MASKSNGKSSGSPSSHRPVSDQKWLVAFAERVQSLNVGQDEDNVGGPRDISKEDGKDDIDSSTEVDYMDAEATNEYRQKPGRNLPRYEPNDGLQGDDVVQSDGEDEEQVQVSRKGTGMSTKTMGKRRAVVKDEGAGVGASQAALSQDSASGDEIRRLRLLVNQYQAENAKLNEANVELKADLAELSRTIQGDGTLSQSDRELRERMFSDMHKLIQKVGVLEKANQLLETDVQVLGRENQALKKKAQGLEGENEKLRDLMDTKPAVVENTDNNGAGVGILIPPEDTIKSRDVVKMVEDLNTRLVNVTQEIQKHVIPSLRVKAADRLDALFEDSSPIIGKGFAQFLKQHATNGNPPRVVSHIAIQSVLARACHIGIESWCPHNKTSALDFKSVYENISKDVNPTIADNWRRVTHSHIPFQKETWKKRVIANLVSVIDLVFSPYLTPTTRELTDFVSPLLDPLLVAITVLRSAITTGLVTKSLFVSFPMSGETLASWMEVFPLRDENASGNNPNGKTEQNVLTCINLGVDRKSSTSRLKVVLKPKVVLEQPPVSSSKPGQQSIATGVTTRKREGRPPESPIGVNARPSSWIQQEQYNSFQTRRVMGLQREREQTPYDGPPPSRYTPPYPDPRRATINFGGSYYP
ncbi:hypothetical protein CVT24_009646 [Panaeolus cyanescens]|uniref:Uncharacterized protein n=1 Tax=Panaeolus cyanescens TaxID=181874 RepID=A0A409Y9X2_9AGAR|nr:hypothetical protein CVT24_009646 [Panaeolus cyanescens]